MRRTKKKLAALTWRDRTEIEKFRQFLGIVGRTKAAGGRDYAELVDAFYGPDGSGDDTRDFRKVQ